MAQDGQPRSKALNTKIFVRMSMPDRAVRVIFGDDVFISYSRRNSEYVLRLANVLVGRDLSPYIDQWASPVGAELPGSLRHALSRSSMLIVVATLQSGASENVELEIRHFLPTGRPVVIIDVGGALSDAHWRDLVRGPEPIIETSAALEQGIPSDDVLSRVLDAARFTRAKSRIRRSAVAALVLLLSSLAALSYFGYRAQAARDAEEAALSAADEATRRADAENERARVEAALAKSAREDATAASEQAGLARRAMKEAEDLKRAAEQKQREAETEAERITRFSRSRSLAQEALDVAPVSPLKGLRRALDAFETEPTPEAISAMRGALAAPRPWRILPGRYRDIDFGTRAAFALRSDGRLEILSLETGEVLHTLDATNLVAAEWSHRNAGLVTTSATGEVSVWDALAGQRTATYRFDAGTVLHASFGPSDTSILTGQRDGTVHAHGLLDQIEQTLMTLDGPIENIWFEERWLVVWTHTDVGLRHAIWSMDGKGVLTPVGRSSNSFINFKPQRPRGRWLIYQDKITDLSPPQLSPTDGFALSGRHLDIHRNGVFGISSADRTATIWQLWTRQPTMLLQAHESEVVAASFSRGGDLVATLTKDGVARLWRFPHRILSRGQGEPSLPHVASLDFSPDGSALASADVWADFLLWDLVTGRANDLTVGGRHSVHERSRVAFDSSGHRLQTSIESGVAVLRDWSARENGSGVKLSPGSVPRFTAEGRIVIAAPKTGGLVVAGTTGENSRVLDAGLMFCDAAPTPDGRHVLASAANGSVTVRRTGDGQVVAALANGPRGCASIELDNRDGTTAIIWDDHMAVAWNWTRTAKGIRLDTGDRPVLTATVRRSMLVVATSTEIRVFDPSDLSLVYQESNAGRANHGLAVHESARLIATGESAMGVGSYIYVRRCDACLPKDRLVAETRRAIDALASEHRRSRVASNPVLVDGVSR